MFGFGPAGECILLCDRCRRYRSVQWKSADLDFMRAHIKCQPRVGVRAVHPGNVPAGYVAS